MKISLYQIDAFASKLFEGNPAAVCPLDEWEAEAGHPLKISVSKILKS